MLKAWTKQSRSFSSCFGWRRTRQRSPRKHLAQNVATVEAAVIAESKLVDIVLQVLTGNAVVRPVNAPFELRPEPLNGVCVSAANNIFARAVVHTNVLEPKLGSEVIDGQFVRHNLRRRFDVAANMVNSIASRDICNDRCADFPASFYNANDGGFADCSAPTKSSALAADISLVRFDYAGQEIAGTIHKLADFVSHAERSFVGNANLPFNLFCGHSVLALGEKENGEEPRFQAGFALVENCASGRVELRSAKCTGIATAFGDSVETAFANVVRKTGAEDVMQTGRVVKELRVKVFEVVSHFFTFARLRRAMTPSCATASGSVLPCSHSQRVRAGTSSSAAASACVIPSRARSDLIKAGKVISVAKKIGIVGLAGEGLKSAANAHCRVQFGAMVRREGPQRAPA